MKSLLCAIVKNENKYLDEWITYHHDLGFDEIILYDNNDLDGEVIDVSKYGFVNVIDYRGKHIYTPNGTQASGTQEEAYNDCYHNHSDGYDWIAYFDIDEFLEIDNNIKVNEFLSQCKFKNADAIQVNWEIYGDNGHVLYEDKPVLERFTSPSKMQTGFVKTILKTKTPNFIAMKVHYAVIKDGSFVYPNGESTLPLSTQSINFEGAKLKHIYTKTIEEWIDRKYNTNDPNGKDYMNKINSRLFEFFNHNKKTKEKIDVILRKVDTKKDTINPKIFENIEKDFNIYIVCGLPGAGKSTYIKNNLSDKTIISSDDIRHEIISKDENKVYEIFYERIKECCKKQMDFVIDDINIYLRQRNKIKEIINQYNPYIKMVWIETSIDTCKKRRENAIPPYIMDTLYKTLNYPQENECNELIVKKGEI